MKTLTRLTVLPLILLLVACAATGPLLIAALGVAGTGLVTYCTTSPGTCPTSVVVWGGEIVKEAVADAVVWESGSTTVDKIATTITNLNTDLVEGKGLIGLSPTVQAQVSAILTTVSELIPLFGNLLPKPVAGANVVAVDGSTVVQLPPMTSRDKAALKHMRAQVAKAKIN